MILIFREFHFFHEPKEERLPRSTHASGVGLVLCSVYIYWRKLFDQGNLTILYIVPQN